MDDPWGSSPWADEVQLPQSTELGTKRDDQKRPIPPAPIATLQLDASSDSPWNVADDDGFGDWATIPADNDGGLIGGGRPDVFDGSASISHKTKAYSLSEDWNKTKEPRIDTSTTLAPISSIESERILRQPSPDPWTTAFTIENETAADTFEHAQPGGPGAVTSRGHDLELETVLATIPTTSAIEALHVDSSEEHITSGRNLHRTGDIKSADSTVDKTALVVKTPDEDPTSSPPSSLSEHSQHEHDELSQESPRTSLDEEPKRQALSRKVSSKIQELVQHYDGLANANLVDAAASSTSNGQDTIKDNEGAIHDSDEEDDDDDDDFGDFEEGLSDEEQDGVAESHTESYRIRPPGRHETTITQLPVTENVGPVHFDIDLSRIEGLFPDLEPDKAFKQTFVPDTIIHDTFSSIEERKVWTRISRYGTMRKHDTGDEDYVRINWAQSRIREDALKIVARWMEEDRASGRVSLGGVSKGSSVFGWGDKRQAPVPLSEALSTKARKEVARPVLEKEPEIPREWPQNHTKKTSTTNVSPSRTDTKGSVKQVVNSEEVQSAMQLPVANFGWNAAPLKPQSLKNMALPGHKSSASMSTIPNHSPRVASPLRRSESVKKTPKNIDIDKSMPALVPRPAIAKSQPTSEAQAPQVLRLATTSITDDDDWGEMVDSPVVGNSVSSAAELWSIDDPTSIPAVMPPFIASQQQTAPKHQPTLSLDDIFNNKAGFSTTTPSTSMMDIGSAFSSTTIAHPAASSSDSKLPAADPWASADFSFFDTASPSPPPPPPEYSKTVLSKQATKSVSFSPVSVLPARSNGKSREEMEHDKIVQDIVRSLPDLSYMLRR